jgi:acyl phosphate:glycerol-3-phosphate acyltransferase
VIPALVAIAAVAYLIGSIPSGLLLARLKNVDVRATGSGNIGATNVARSAGKTLGLLTLLLDAAKGALPVLLAGALDLFPEANPQFDQRATIAAALGAVTGHIFPITLGFRGGKGVATALGALAALAPASLPLALLAFVAGFGTTRRVSVGSICAAMAAPFGAVVAGYPPAVSAAIAVLAGLILYRHRDNMARIRAGTEPRFGSGSEPK